MPRKGPKIEVRERERERGDVEMNERTTKHKTSLANKNATRVRVCEKRGNMSKNV